jgi:hydroxyacyl-ACP dehydratase HTD2-like protein with hotdog domain
MMLAAGFDDVVVHGWLCFAHMCRCVTNWAVPTVATIDSYRIRYLRPLYPGPVSCGGLVENVHGDRAELGLWATNMAGEKVTIADMVLRPTS